MDKPQRTPTKEKPWFCFDGDEHEYFETEDLATKASQILINHCLDESWDENVHNIFVGKITKVSTQIDYVKRPDVIDEDGMDESGDYWLDEWSYRCNYKILPL